MVMPTQKFGGAPAADMSDPGKAALVQMIKENQRADAGFKDADKNKDGVISGAEFFDHCKGVDVGPEDAGKLMKEVPSSRAG